MNHPVQPIVKDSQGVLRFKENKIVTFLLEICRLRGIADLNSLALMPFDNEDRVQLAQLIGYSVSGFGDLYYVTDEDYSRAENEVEKCQSAGE